MNYSILKIDLAMAKAALDLGDTQLSREWRRKVDTWAHERLMKEVAAFQPGIAGRLFRGCRG